MDLLGIVLGLVNGRADELIMRVGRCAAVHSLVIDPAAHHQRHGHQNVGADFNLWFHLWHSNHPCGSGRDAGLCDQTNLFWQPGPGVNANARLSMQELLPNVRDVLLVDGSMNWSWMLLGFTSLSFLGFGVVPPTPDWGFMIAKNREILAVQPWAVFGPVLMLSTLIIGINLFSDAFAKALGLDRSQGAPV